MALDYSREHPIFFYGSCEVKETRRVLLFLTFFIMCYQGMSMWTTGHGETKCDRDQL